MNRLALRLLLLLTLCIFFVFTLMAGFFTGAVLLERARDLLMGNPLPPRYYAVITSADLNLTRTSWFELSLGVASPGRYCLKGGMAVQVSYRGAPLARKVISSSQAVCTSWWWTPPRKAVWTSIVALGNNTTTALPEFLVDALATGTKRGMTDFDVSIWTVDGKMAAWCGPRRVGDDDKAAAAECHVRYSKYLH